jgi:hypothetical protein
VTGHDPIEKSVFGTDAILLIFASCVAVLIAARAFWQDITIDEASTALFFVLPVKSSEPHHWISHSNNHVLNSLLMTWSTNLFGDSPFALRLPALVGGMAYLGISAALVRTFTSQAVFAIIAFALLALNPFVLDYLFVARGYSVALACQTAAILVLARRVLETRTSTPVLAGVFAGFGLAANYSFLFGFVGLFVCYIGWYSLAKRRRAWDLVRQAWALFWPTAMILFVLCFDNIRRMSGGYFIWGADSIRDSWFSVRSSVFLDPNPFVTPQHLTALFKAFSEFAPTLVAITTVSLFFALAFGRVKPGFKGIAAICIGSCVFNALAYLVCFDMGILKLPSTRTNLPLVPPFTVALIAGIASLEKPAWRLPFEVVTAAISLLFVSTLHFWYISEWRFDADIKSMVQAACDYAKAHSIDEIATTMHFYSAGNYYIRYLGYSIKTTGRDGDGVQTLPPDKKIYLVHPFQPGIGSLEGVRIIFTGPVSGAMVAVRD